MKLKTIISLATALAVFLPTNTMAIATTLPTKKFSNCAALNRVYPGGVAKSRSSHNRGGATNYTPKVSAKLYAENKGKDRDHDGIACER